MKISVLTPSIRPEGLVSIRESLMKQTFTDFEWLVEIGLGKHDLNAAFNRMLCRAKGELIVFAEDWMKFDSDYLQKFWDAYQEDPYTFFTAPVGKTLDWEKIEWDWRNHPASQMVWHSWEIDSGAAPLVCLKRTGGFDEELDGTWAGDNVSVAWRAKLLGYNFKNLRDNKAVAFDHNLKTKHPFADTFNGELNNQRMREVEMGELIIDYIK